MDKDDNVTMLEVILRTNEGDVIVRDTTGAVSLHESLPLI